MNLQPSDPRVALVIASIRPERYGSTVAAWAADRITAHGGIDLDVLDLMDLALPSNLDGSGDTTLLRSRVERADAFVIVTPEYNHGYPGHLKTAIDTVLTGWATKPVAFVSYGGSAGGARAVEQLRPVLTELDAVTIREAVTLVRVWDLFDGDGRFLGEPGPESAMSTMLERLLWWADALGAARVESRLPAAVG